MSKPCILILNGPNLNFLGKRDPSVYGSDTFADLKQLTHVYGEKLSLHIECRQTNHEGVLIDWIQEGFTSFDGMIINPSGYTHTSVAIRDALEILAIPVIEVHLTNIYARESFRQKSLISSAVAGTICGLGVTGYTLAIQALYEQLHNKKQIHDRKKR